MTLSDDYGLYRGDARDPRTPDPPEAECRNCGEVYDHGPFYDAWLGDSANFDNAGDDGIAIHHPEDCPRCRCTECGCVTATITDAKTGEPWCAGCIALESSSIESNASASSITAGLGVRGEPPNPRGNDAEPLLDDHVISPEAGADATPQRSAPANDGGER